MRNSCFYFAVAYRVGYEAALEMVHKYYDCVVSVTCRLGQRPTWQNDCRSRKGNVQRPHVNASDNFLATKQWICCKVVLNMVYVISYTNF